MSGPHWRLALWAAPKHSGKTAAASSLAEKARTEGFSVTGLLAPGVYKGGRLIGYDVVDLRTTARRPLARRGLSSPLRAGSYGFLPEGLVLGREALSGPAARSSDLVIVDEFGPLELSGWGWRPAVDKLIREAKGLIVLVVRDELVAAVLKLYGGSGCQRMQAGSAAVETIIEMLRQRSSRKKTGRPGGQ
ncbi:MAG: nucleoside-triphosphatase [Planctomycetota bacterium]|jgi:nucleoside-triphosphatase THEP1